MEGGGVHEWTNGDHLITTGLVKNKKLAEMSAEQVSASDASVSSEGLSCRTWGEYILGPTPADTLILKQKIKQLTVISYEVGEGGVDREGGIFK